MSSLPPNKQSLAGGIFNTVTKMGSVIGLGVSTSIFNAESRGTSPLPATVRPYQLVFWFCVASAALGFCCVPFLTMGTQGGENTVSNRASPPSDESEAVVVSEGGFALEENIHRGGNGK